MNINVGTSKVYDAFNLGDDRVGAPKDKVPQFVTMSLEKSLLKPARDGGKVQRRRALGPSVFFTPWAYVDHEFIQPGGDTGTTTFADLSEAYYVISGEGSVTVNGETVAIKKGDAIPVDLGQAKSFKAGAAPLELMIIGVSKDMAAKNAFAANPANENPEPLARGAEQALKTTIKGNVMIQPLSPPSPLACSLPPLSRKPRSPPRTRPSSPTTPTTPHWWKASRSTAA